MAIKARCCSQTENLPRIKLAHEIAVFHHVLFAKWNIIHEVGELFVRQVKLKALFNSSPKICLADDAQVVEIKFPVKRWISRD